MKLTKKHAAFAELVGITLILLSLAWGVFIREITNDILADARLYKVEAKLDEVWMYLAVHGRHAGDQSTPSTSSYRELAGKYWLLGSMDSRVRHQSEVFNYVGGGLFALGSVLTAIGRYKELESKLTS